MTDIHLSKKPAFGFETEHYCASQLHTNKGVKDYNRLNDRAKKKIAHSLGGKIDFITKRRKTAMYKANASKIVGYIPVLGTIRGIGRIVDTFIHIDRVKPANNLARGVIEMLSLGIFLLPVDLAVTAYRHRDWKKLNAQG